MNTVAEQTFVSPKLFGLLVDGRLLLVQLVDLLALGLNLLQQLPGGLLGGGELFFDGDLLIEIALVFVFDSGEPGIEPFGLGGEGCLGVFKNFLGDVRLLLERLTACL